MVTKKDPGVKDDEQNTSQPPTWDFTSTLSLNVDQTQASGAGRIPTGYTIADLSSLVQNGRTFQAYREGAYILPNDGEEQDRLDLQHTIWELILDGQLALAPMDRDPEHALDIATGTGLWAWEFAASHPGSSVVGTDLSLIQGDRPHVTNCRFVREDSEKDIWVWDHKFDYIHARMICTSFTDTRELLRKAYDGMAENGWIELQDTSIELRSPDGSHHGTALNRIYEMVNQGLRAIGINGRKAMFYKQWLEEVGFTDVVETRYPAPTNTWPSNEKFKTVGAYACVNISRFLPAVSAKMLPDAGLSPTEAQNLVDAAIVDSKNHSIHAYIPCVVVYGRKPAAGEIVATSATSSSKM